MYGMVKNIRDYFNRRSSARDTEKGASTERRVLAIENGECASRLLRNEDFALMFNLYRFDLLSALEESNDDSKRIGNAYLVAGVRDFLTFVEKMEYLGKVAQKRAET